MRQLRVKGTRQREVDLERAIIHVYTLAGCVVYRLSQGFRPDAGGTRQTPGLPDLRIFALSVKAYWEHEVKTREGLLEHERWVEASKPRTPSNFKRWRRAQGQKLYRENAVKVGLISLIGGMDVAEAHLLYVGLARCDDAGQFILTPKAALAWEHTI